MTTAASTGGAQAGFGNPAIANMIAIGDVGSQGARIWTRVDGPGVRELHWWPLDQPAGVRRRPLPDWDPGTDGTSSVWIEAGLEPDRRYAVALRDGDRELARGRFQTAPAPGAAPPERFSVALLSCHEPFDDHGNVTSAAEPMLEAACRAFERHNVRQVVMAGDQLYSDFPKHLSLFDEDYFRSIAPPGRERLLDCSEEEIRAIFHVRYRHFWSLRGWRKLMANFPCYPIIDDHEIVDNWGSAEEHREAKWQAYRNGAFAAYRDYQAALVCEGGGDPAKPLDYQMTLADTATYVMDLRSNRRVGEEPRVVAAEQMDSFERFLERHTQQRVLFVVLSVPAIHLPRLLTRTAAAVTPDGEDFSDRWSSRGHKGDRDRLLRRIHRHQEQYPQQRIVLLSGDIHIGCLHELSWDDGRPNLYQFISSGITHDTGRFVQSLSSLIMRAKRKVTAPDSPDLYVRLLRGDGPARDNPCGRLNFGIVEFERRPGQQSTSMRFYLYTHDGDEPHCQYRSPDVLA